MFSHIMIGSNDVARSKKFYDALFAAMGAQPTSARPSGQAEAF
jgi:catechol 2,3-dioxygenase-like lactoylglutathione lyase family enzyme